MRSLSATNLRDILTLYATAATKRKRRKSHAKVATPRKGGKVALAAQLRFSFQSSFAPCVREGFPCTGCKLWIQNRQFSRSFIYPAK
jgi:hypothetical protein